jgi:hypothetical protein
MLAEMELMAYAEEIRRKICAGCLEQPRNGVEPSRPGLVGWIMKAPRLFMRTPAASDGPDCEDCRRPMDFLQDLLAQAVNEAGAMDEQWECVRRRLHRPAPKPGATIRELYQAYEEATGTVIGCD